MEETLDVQSLLPKATALLSNSKLVPFQLDSNMQEVLPKRILLSNSTLDDVWDIHVPDEHQNTLIQTTIEMQIKMDQLSEKVDKLLLRNHQENVMSGIVTTASETTEENNPIGSDTQTGDADIEEEYDDEHNDHSTTTDEAGRSQSPPPVFSMTSTSHEAPPSYETSILSSIKSLNSKMRMYESYISNRHKSPKWMSKRQTWLSREPDSIEHLAFQLVQLEMSLLWTAVSEAWLDERETWLTLVSTASSERHLASALINLERHTLVMNQDWPLVKEGWVNGLLELIVLPLGHT
ncbi:unnamed protein product [Rhizopus stolonifer]